MSPWFPAALIQWRFWTCLPAKLQAYVTLITARDQHPDVMRTLLVVIAKIEKFHFFASVQKYYLGRAIFKLGQETFAINC